MSFIPIPKAVRVSFEFLFAGQTVVFTITIGKNTDWTAGQMDTLADDMFNWYTDNLKGALNDSIVLKNINVLDQASDTGPSVNSPITSGGAGTKTGVALPNNCAMCVSFGSALRGRSFRGRAYVAGIDNDDRDDEVTFTTAIATAIAGAFGVINSYMTVSGAYHAIPSRFHANAPRTTGVITPVSTVRVDTAIDSQRRRLAGRGN